MKKVNVKYQCETAYCNWRFYCHMNPFLIVTKCDSLAHTILLRKDSAICQRPVTVKINLLEINSIRSVRSAFTPVWCYHNDFIQNQSVMITVFSIPGSTFNIWEWENRFCTCKEVNHIIIICHRLVDPGDLVPTQKWTPGLIAREAFSVYSIQVIKSF